MACFICGRVICCPSFHSLEEQVVFAPAELAYEEYLKVRDQCQDVWDDEHEELDE